MMACDPCGPRAAMIANDPTGQYDEIRDALTLVKKFHGFARERVRRLGGWRYRDDWTGEPIYKPHEWEYVTNMVPNLVYRTPTVQVEGLLQGIDDELQFAVESVLPQWIHGSNFARGLQPTAYNTMFLFGVRMLSLEPLPGYDGAVEPLPLWPMAKNIDPFKFFQDPRGGRDNWRFRGHYWRADRADLLAMKGPGGEPMFDPAVIQAMAVDTDDPEFQSDDDGSPRGKEAQRNIVTGYEFYDRERGTCYTLGSKMGGGYQWLREPKRYVGFPDDPYVLYGCYMVPGQVYPLPPLAVTDEKVREINAHRKAIAEDAASAKKMLLVDSSVPAEEVNRIMNAPTRSVLHVNGVTSKAYQEADFGGPQDAHLKYVAEMLMPELNEASGQSDLRRGNITGKATATEVAEVAEAEDVRTEFARQTFHECAVEELEKVARLMVRSPQVQVPVVVEMPDPVTGQMVKTPSLFVGGRKDTTGAMGRIRVKIEPYSMERVNRQAIQRRTQMMGGMVLESIPLALSSPMFPWAQFFNDQGEAVNMKGLGDRYFGWVAPMAQMQAMMGMVPGAQSQPGAKGEEAEQGAPPDPAMLAAGV